MNNKQQTAVEWLIEQLRKNENIRWRGTPFFELSEQAKEMEKQKLEDAWVEGVKNWNPSKTFEQYYKETYGGNK
jgi:hypothetical protein